MNERSTGDHGPSAVYLVTAPVLAPANHGRASKYRGLRGGSP